MAISVRLPPLQNPNRHERPGPRDLSGSPWSGTQIHGDVQINQDPFRMFLAYIIDDDILSRHILMEDLSILKE